jgi:hypothetical protein
MAISTGLTNRTKQIAADAMCPEASVIMMALIRVNATHTYDSSYLGAYVVGLDGDECPSSNGYVQGGQPLMRRVSAVNGYVDYGDVVWNANGSLSASGAVIYDSSQGNRIVGFVDFGGTKTATDATFTVKMSDSAGLIGIE